MPSDYPVEIEVRSSEGQAVLYHLAPEFYARRSAAPLSPGDRLVQRLDEDFAVFQGPASSSAMAKGNVSPVYRAQPSGMFAIPTGRLWVRFAEGIDATQKREMVEKAGFRFEESPPWAAHAAWVRAKVWQGSGRLGCDAAPGSAPRRRACRASDAIAFSAKRPSVSRGAAE
jgi:hypothetical protein